MTATCTVHFRLNQLHRLHHASLQINNKIRLAIQVDRPSQVLLDAEELRAPACLDAKAWCGIGYATLRPPYFREAISWIALIALNAIKLIL